MWTWITPTIARAGVTYVDRVTHQTYQVRAKSVILCAQALESDAHSAQLLDARSIHRDLANSSGAAGPLPDGSCGGRGRCGRTAGIRSDAQRLRAPHRANGIYVIRFRNVLNGPIALAFIRGYGFQGGARRGVQFQRAEGFGADYKQAVKARQLRRLPGSLRRIAGALGQLTARSIPTCATPGASRRCASPMTHGENEKAMMEDAPRSLPPRCWRLRARKISRINSRIAMPGMAIHETGHRAHGDRSEEIRAELV